MTTATLTDELTIHDITICKLPYQMHPFVHGVRNGLDVWLRADGSWTETDGDDRSAIPLNDSACLWDKKK